MSFNSGGVISGTSHNTPVAEIGNRSSSVRSPLMDITPDKVVKRVQQPSLQIQGSEKGNEGNSFSRAKKFIRCAWLFLHSIQFVALARVIAIENN